MLIGSAIFSQSGNEVTLDIDGGEAVTVSLSDYKRILSLTGEKAPPAELDDRHKGAVYILAEKLICLKYCSYILSFGDKSEKNLRKRLSEKGFGEKAIELSVAALKKDGILNDKAFIKRLIEKYVLTKYYGERRIREELYKKGFSSETVSEVLEECEFDFDQAAKQLYIKLSASLDMDNKDEKQRICNKMVRFGHTYDTVKYIFSDFIE